MSLLGWVVGLSIADAVLGEANEREERHERENAELRRRNFESERRISKLEDELRRLRRGDRGW